MVSPRFGHPAVRGEVTTTFPEPCGPRTPRCGAVEWSWVESLNWRFHNEIPREHLACGSQVCMPTLFLDPSMSALLIILRTVGEHVSFCSTDELDAGTQSCREVQRKGGMRCVLVQTLVHTTFLGHSMARVRLSVSLPAEFGTPAVHANLWCARSWFPWGFFGGTKKCANCFSSLIRPLCHTDTKTLHSCSRAVCF